ncbi:MAG: outer membrane porin, OprD family [Epsilonproteobacteria bacterium]|nr:outer membrane porin, OprD family [Campylobacterota bacterium]
MDMIYIAQNDIATQVQLEKTVQQQEKQSIGALHNKTLARRQVVKELPKKADSIDEAFDYVDGYGKIRFGYIGNHIKEESPDWQNSFGSAIGGVVGIKTATYRGFSANVAGYISQDLPFLYDDDKTALDFLTSQGKSFAYLAEASINFENEFLEFQGGRIAVDLPYADTDDIRMAQNTFEGAWAQISMNDDLSAQLFYLHRWAGFDSQDEEAGIDQSEFKELVEDSRGMIGAGVSYEYAKESEVALWYQNVENFADIFYTELNGVYDINDDIHFDYGAQYTSIKEDENSGVDGDVYGAMLIGHYQEFFLSLAVNYAVVDEDKYVTDGFGGGPYFTSLDEATIAVASEALVGEDIDMYRTGIGYDAESIYSSFEYAYGYMSGENSHIDEHDFIYTFNKDEKMQAQIIFAKYTSKTNELNRVVAQIDYNF